jgi:hypothetical protein
MPTTSRARTTTDAPTSVLTLKRPPTHPGEVLLQEYLKPAESPTCSTRSFSSATCRRTVCAGGISVRFSKSIKPARPWSSSWQRLDGRRLW